ncbi:hypothetical protein FSP39_005735 [Pinctada imbricata]|uniref:Snurportin-1 n=1 Tax=Pinctada imbricata TaxID=66713 RepID=A0AA88Y9A9_PINIB|nr:hypothetical protein FSP39_005735 [Pinctada imbricata]
MDELTQQLAGSFTVSNDPNSTAAQHPRFAQYKSRTSVDQNTRRDRILNHQKDRRFDFMSHVRNLSDDLWDNTDAESVGSEDSMDVQFEGEKPKFRKPGKYYRNQLMYSEWLVEVPSDFEQEWLAVVCPWGKRCLVVASKGRTHAYSKSGYRINSFSSHLPGGSFKQKGRNKDNAILDCLFNEQEGTYYVLDIMCWKNHPIYDSETEFRFYWLASKVIETPEMAQKSPDNTIDGVLFYHKRCHYTFGSTPLVVWLKPYMLPEILTIEINEKLAAERPDSYTTYAAHMDHVQKEKEKAALEKSKKGKSPHGKKKTPKKTKGSGDAGEGPGMVQVDNTVGLPDPKPVKKDRVDEKRIYGQDFRMDVSVEPHGDGDHGDTMDTIHENEGDLS